jgi:hypothetical protein
MPINLIPICIVELLPIVPDAIMHEMLPIHTYSVGAALISPKVTADNMNNAAKPYLYSLKWYVNVLESKTAAEAGKILMQLSDFQKAIICGGNRLETRASFPHPAVGQLYELNVVLKDHVKSMADLAAGTPFPAARVLKNKAGESYVE